MNAKIDSTFGDTSKSEEEKYLLTLMADMGLQDMADLSEEEKSAWISAATPTYKIKRKSFFTKLYKNIIKVSNAEDRERMLILVHPEVIMEQSFELFEDYLNIIKDSIYKFEKVFIYTYFPKGYIDHQIEKSSNPEKSLSIYKEFLDLASDNVRISRDKNMLEAAFKEEISEYLIENENLDIFISGGYQELCLRESCNNFFRILTEELRAFDHSVSIYEPLIYSNNQPSKRGNTEIGSMLYPAHKTTWDHFDQVEEDAWFENIDRTSLDKNARVYKRIGLYKIMSELETDLIKMGFEKEAKKVYYLKSICFGLNKD